MVDIEDKKQTAEEDEPEWIRDPRVAVVDAKPNLHGTEAERFKQLSQMCAEICEGETVCCEFCGAPFPMWPAVDISDHALRAHAENLTIFARAMLTVLCSPELEQQHQMLFSMNFNARISMRRRAWKLGYTVVREPEGTIKLHD